MPLPAKGDKLGDVQVKGAPPILVVATTGDPATPYAAAQTFLARIAGSSLLTFDSTEHTAYGSGRSTCIDDFVNPYLLDLVMPPGGHALLTNGHACSLKVPVASMGMRARPTRSSPITRSGVSHSRSSPTGTRSARSVTCASAGSS